MSDGNRRLRSNIWMHFTPTTNDKARCDICKHEQDPLAWWRGRVNVYPRLSQLARRHLCMVATSVPSERVFSKSGQLISDRRSRLSPKNVKMVMFLNANITK